MKILAPLCLLLTLFLPQQFSSERTVALVFRDPVERVLIIPEDQARAEYAELSKKTVLSESERHRFDALVSALQTVPQPAKCITWRQHVAEVSSWWAAPEREYVPCDDPRVGPPKENQ